MEVKKKSEKDLNKQRGMFFMIGMILAISFMLFAFKWGTSDGPLAEYDVYEEETEVIDIPPTEQKIKPPPPPPPPVLVVVEDDELLEDEEDIIPETEVDEDTFVEPEQEDQDEVDEDKIFIAVEEQPEFPGGEAALFKYLQNNIKYPSQARDNGIQGTVYLNFVVETDGSITDVKVLRGIGAGCDEEAIAKVKNMPKWKPGKQRNKAVRVSFNLPVNFKLRG